MAVNSGWTFVLICCLNEKIVEAIPEIVQPITIGQQSYGFDVEIALEIVNNTREVVNELTKHLKVMRFIQLTYIRLLNNTFWKQDKVSGETRKTMDIGDAVKNIVNANPNGFTNDLANSGVCIGVSNYSHYIEHKYFRFH